jgi:glycosyltransferase involved in cell wall biosynthesis
MTGATPISLVCTLLNERAGIAELLASVDLQTLQPDEMVIVDAGSEDGTVDVVRDFAATRPWVRILVESGCTIARGRNLAIREARHDLIAMTDAGTRLDRRWLEELVLPLLRDPSADAVGGWTVMDPRTPFEQWVGILHHTPDSIDPGKFLPSCRTLAIRRAVWEKLDGFPEWLSMVGEDTVFLENLKRAGFKLLLAPGAIVYWHPRGSIGAYCLQQYRYGAGDGEARLYPILFLKRTVLVLSLFTSVLGIAVNPILAILAGTIVFVGFVRLMAPVGKRGVTWWRLVPLYGLVLVGETAQVSGYVRGLLGRRRPAG